MLTSLSYKDSEPPHWYKGVVQMVLAMARPVRHPVTGIWWFRKGVPKHLRPLVGKVEEKVSLRTRDPAEAKIAHARVSAEVEARWQQLAAGVQELSHRQIEGIAGAIYREMIEAHGDDPDKVPAVALTLDRAMSGPGVQIFMAGDPKASATLLKRLAERNGDQIDAWLDRHGLRLDPESRRKLDERVNAALLQAREQLNRMAKGDYRTDPNGDRFPKLDVPGSQRAATGKNSPLAAFDAYAKENLLKDRTIKRWRPIFAKIEEQKKDIRELTRDWAIAWKDQLLESGLSQKTVKEVYLASLKAVCVWAVTNNRMHVNPVEQLTIRLKKRQRLRDPGYTDKEAQRILSAAMAQDNPTGLSEHYRKARRWVPFLCAYTGARVGEIAQLRKEDIKIEDGIHLIRITPEAGAVKTDAARWVAMHPNLIEQGFIAWATTQPAGPLFTGKQKGGKTPAAERVGQHLSTWIRNDVGITDVNILPNHAWRHRFKTLARHVGISDDFYDYIQGHSSGSASGTYGIFTPAALYREISRIPVASV